MSNLANRKNVVNHIMEQLREGFTLAAADHILLCNPSELPEIIKDFCESAKTEYVVNRTSIAEKIFATTIRMGLNLQGLDGQIVGIPPDIGNEALRILLERSQPLEEQDASSASLAVERFLKGMESVNSGDSLLSYMAEKIRERFVVSKSISSFIRAFGDISRQTVYWKMVEKRYCKFGNDYARGLEMLRHLGFSQVSTNPVLAAKAFDEDLSLRDQLLDEINTHPDWVSDPKIHGDDMALSATLMALWPNLEIFRPLSVRTQNMDYMISFQLNPNIAEDADASIEDAKNAHNLAAKHLTEYDQRLGLTNPGAVPPNIVLKVAGSSTAARKITRELNAAGIGTNNTVVYTVGQEVQLILDSFEGKARAVKAARPITRTYETNMGGRLVSHLREVEATKIFSRIKQSHGEKHSLHLLKNLAKELNLSTDLTALLEQPGSVENKAQMVCSFTYLKSLSHPAFLKVVAEIGLRNEIEQLENDLQNAGTLIARRVYQTFFTETNRKKLIDDLQHNYGLTTRQATSILESVDILPASKRIPEDTYNTLAYPNMCNTEFPNHARAVQLFAEQQNFALERFKDAALQTPDAEQVKRLSELPDFVQSYEITAELGNLLTAIGLISTPSEYGLKGLSENQWPQFGSVIKTMNEFRKAYDRFTAQCIELANKRITESTR
jgi:transaldolase